MIFRPERFVATETQQPEEDPASFSFGFGRRICPGRFLADNTLFLSVSQSLAAFNIAKEVENGVEVDVEAKFQPGVISHPAPFRYQISPRSKEHEELILSVEKLHPWEESDAPALETL